MKGLGMNWRTIDSAPKDGTWLLLCGGETSEDDPPLYTLPDTRRAVTAKWDFNCWVAGHWDSAWRTTYDNATHWMPIPNLPDAHDEVIEKADDIPPATVKALVESLEELTGDYDGGADRASDDPYVMERAHAALAAYRGKA